MTFAILPMYDFAHLRTETDALWHEIATAFRTQGIDAPTQLTRRDDLDQAWLDSDLLLGQTCGLPYVTQLRDKVTLVGTPIYDVPHCGQGTYASVIIVANNSSINALSDFSGQSSTSFAINSFVSQSGYAALMHEWAKRGLINPEKSSFLITGSHLASIEAVATGRADVAAIDSVTWALAKEQNPHCQNVKIIAVTDQTPGLPLITAMTDKVEILRDGVSQALENYQGPLKINGLRLFSDSDYDQIKTRYDLLLKF